jgi:hypothetical protein
LYKFCIVILEYLNIIDNRILLASKLDNAKNRWFKLIKPEYNILEKTESSIGYTHSLESRGKISNA